MSKTQCKAIAASGDQCTLDAGSTGYCHIHDPARIEKRMLARREQDQARKVAWEKGARLREVIEVAKKVCRAKNWRYDASDCDTQEWKYVTIRVSKLVKARDLCLEEVSGIIHLSLVANKFRASFEKTSFYKYGLDDLWESVKTAIFDLPWLAVSPKTPQATGMRLVGPPNAEPLRRIFIVHGHDEEVKQSVARHLEKLGLNPIILHEQPDQGRTIIEKFETYANVGFAVVLLTPDDIGGHDNSTLKPRARQNVILELGFFIGRLGRGKVCALYKGNVELPSDLSGVLWIELDEHGAWRLRLSSEIRAAGLPADLNKL